jgi:translation initiation factor 2B subunit (eIF-2B alpha/beta/delta family)
MPPTTKAAEESSAAAAAVQAEITQIETEITKWKTNLEFIGQLQALQQTLEKVESVAAEKQTIIEQQLQNLQAAQQGVETAKQAKQLIETEADAIRQKMLELQTAQ